MLLLLQLKADATVADAYDIVSDVCVADPVDADTIAAATAADVVQDPFVAAVVVAIVAAAVVAAVAIVIQPSACFFKSGYCISILQKPDSQVTQLQNIFGDN